MKNIKDIVEKSIKNFRVSMMGSITSILKSKKVAYVMLSDEEEIRDVKIISPYGFFSLPLAGQNGQILFNNTLKSASLIGVENNSPVELNPGEAIVYCKSGSYILLKDGKVRIKGNVEVEGNILYTGNITKGALD
jgi:phage gp45-like